MDKNDDLDRQISDLKMMNDELQESFLDLMEQFLRMRDVNLSLTEAVMEAALALRSSDNPGCSAHGRKAYLAVGRAISKLKEIKPLHERDDYGIL